MKERFLDFQNISSVIIILLFENHFTFGLEIELFEFQDTGILKNKFI